MTLRTLYKTGLSAGVVAIGMLVSTSAAFAEHQPHKRHIKHSDQKHFTNIADRHLHGLHRSHANYHNQKEKVAKRINRVNKQRYYSRNHGARFNNPRNYQSNRFGYWNKHNSRPWYVTNNHWRDNRGYRSCD